MIPKKFMRRTIQKYYDAHETEVSFLQFDGENNAPTNIYGERLTKVYKDPIKALGYLEMEPTELRLQELGWHKEPPEIIIRLPFTEMVEKGLAEENGKLILSVDDKMDIPNMGEYKIGNITHMSPFINNIPTFICVGGRKFISGSGTQN